MPPDLEPQLKPDLQRWPGGTNRVPTFQRPPRRDAMALGFGVAFVVFGVVGLARALGAAVPSAWLYPIILIGVGAAGLWSSFSRELR